MSSSATTSAASASPENADQNEVTLKEWSASFRKLQLSQVCGHRCDILIMKYLIHNCMYGVLPSFNTLCMSCKGVEIIYEACLHRNIETVNGCEMIKVTSEEIAEWVRRLKSISNNVSSSEEESSEEESSEDEQWVACDYCGEKNINPEDLCFDKNLAEIGGGYAHDSCMTKEQLEEWEKAAGRSDY